MRLKCQPAALGQKCACRLCQKSVQKGYQLKGPIKDFCCETCYEKLYGPLAEKTAFHMTDIFRRSFWRPFHIEEGVVMFPWISASRLQQLNLWLKRLLPLLLIGALLASGLSFSMLQRIPGNFAVLFFQLIDLLGNMGSHLLTIPGKLFPVLIHLKDVVLLVMSAVWQMIGQLVGWIGGLL